ncbi:MAG: hypothetical protein QM477_00950 [Planctomycetota bacterium]
MRTFFALSLVLVLSGGALTILPAAHQPSAQRLLDSPSRVAYDPMQGLIQVECKAQELRYFNAFLLETEAPAAPIPWPTPAPESHSSRLLQIDVWSGRQLNIDVRAGSMQLSGSAWEDPPMLTWGPDWASVTWRTADPQSVLQWRRHGRSPIQEVTAVCDSFDGLKRRVWLETLKAGERIDLRFRPSGFFFPARSWTTWQEYEVPQVDPAGNRPTSRLR